jgi:hypothetical protein
MRKHFHEVVVAVAFLLLASLMATAAVADQKPATLVVHPKWHVAATQVFASGRQSVFADARHLFAWSGTPPNDHPAAATGIAIDEQTGRRTTVSFRPGCYPWAIGGPWVAFNCQSPPYQLYNLADRQARSLSVSEPLASQCNSGNGCGVRPAAIGKRWIEWAWGGGCYHCLASFAFQNLQTGQLRTLPAWKPGGTVIPDLDSTALVYRLCQPLRVPQEVGQNTSNVGTLTLYGRFALIQGTGPAGYPVNTYLQRCGSPRRYPLTTGGKLPAGSHRAVAWQSVISSNRAEIRGVLLPSARPFRIPLPASIGGSQVALTSRHLYALDASGKLWSTPTSIFAK